MNSGVPQPPVPSKPTFKLDPDTIVALLIGEAAFIGSVFPSDPKVALVCQLIGGSALVFAGVFHLDGK